ncbi:extracellular solute-binding protein 3 [Tanacetum coccineum]
MRRSIQEQRDTGQVDVCSGPEWQMNKHEISPCQQLDVWVPKKTGFTEFVKVEGSEVKGGFSIAIFFQPIFKSFDVTNDTYDNLLKSIVGKNCTCAAGDFTVRASRAQYVNFTIPYLSSEVYMLVHVAILEYRVGNPKFKAPYSQALRMVIWFPISTFFFNEGRILNRNSKVVLVMWLSMIFIVAQIFTATLSSWLTIDQLRPRLPTSFESAGYQDGSFLKDFIMQKYNCSDTKLLPLKSIEDYKYAFSNKSVKIIFDELPYINLFLAKYGSDYMKFGPINQESGIAFAFPPGSSLFPIFSMAVINVTESDTMMDMKKKYLGFSPPDNSQPNQPLPQSLDVQSFIGLFIFIGTVAMAAIILSEISLRRENKKVLPISAEE